MVIPTQYFAFVVLFVVHYILTSLFPSIHMLCLFGGMMNILINLQHINPQPKLRIVLKTETDNHDRADPEPDLAVQFHNLYRGFKYGVAGYVITIAIVPYYIYLCVNPGKNFESFKTDSMATCMKLFVHMKTKFA